jgi:elongation factor 1 alpha-like protein
MSARIALAAIETESDRVQWAAAGSNVTLYLTAIDPIHLDVGRVLCPPSAPVVELASAFTARIIVFDIQVPILAGTSVSEKIDPPLRICILQTMFHAFCFMHFVQIELFHHSRDVPAAISKLNATLDRASGAVTKHNPRFLVFSSAPRSNRNAVLSGF